ncbi:lysyl oxidase homolog 3B-like isoform X1 [Stegostoma tigrinum]|uniref:lysyl oxidase homolog 3B-like isoform X1 n=1 Tax=Stegostoma tigrinum TaxID=3053191 RepID=UPI0028705550|nr:lysyl oxidase homolog 3B-like isoform X1 [Stegostoma tigrinum]
MATLTGRGRWELSLRLLLLGLWLLVVCAQRMTPVPPQREKVAVRLSGYPRKHNEGRVEVSYEGEWGTICDDDFKLENAVVLCRMLGFTTAIGWTHSAKYGKGTGRVWLDNLDCRGTEKDVSECKSLGWGQTDCTHEEDAGVICKDERIPGFVDSNVISVQSEQIEEVRLKPAVPNARQRLPITEGFVEVKYMGQWEQVCDNGWNYKNSRVVCGMLGFPAERRTNKRFYKRLRRRRANGKRARSSPPRMVAERQVPRYRVHSVVCAGTETHFSLCQFELLKGNVSNQCPGGAPAAASCVPGPLFSKGRRRKQPKLSVRLKAGARIGEGRVEILKGTEWGTICDDRWNTVSASVVCRELGFGSAKEALTGARMGKGMGPIYLNEVHCTGFEKSIWDCAAKNISQDDCRHTEDAAVRCNVPYMGFETTIRITGGRTRYEGRLEILITAANGTQQWGLVCGEAWGMLEAMVACRQLGVGYANQGVQETWYWDADTGAQEMVLSGVKCTGDEMTLSQCQSHGANVKCKKSSTRFAAGVICSETSSDLILDARLVQQTAYIEDRPLHMLYCAAEEDCLSSSARNANWPYGHRRLLRFSSEIHNIGRADFRPKAGRHSWVWHECHGHYHSMDIFTHYDILTLNGSKVAEGHKASFCLEDSDCDDNVAKRYECANFGEQGITVGCWDSYRHDIDCQWIDITDVKPGNYIMQVVINPNYEVSESDFTNNAMKCNCKYDGHRIWMHNCHIGDAFSEEAEREFEKYPGQLNNLIP